MERPTLVCRVPVPCPFPPPLTHPFVLQQRDPSKEQLQSQRDLALRSVNSVSNLDSFQLLGRGPTPFHPETFLGHLKCYEGSGALPPTLRGSHKVFRGKTQFSALKRLHAENSFL